MGGYFSGRRGGRPTIEATDSIKIDVSDVVPTRGRKLPAGVKFWGTRGSEPYSIIVMVTLDSPEVGIGTMRMWHASIHHPTGSETGPQDYTVEMRAEPCTLGGRRWSFRCPRTWRRCRTLYLPNGAYRFASRAAYRLVYQSQRVSEMDRCHAKLARLCRKVGASYSSAGAALPPRPSRMRRRTYDRLLEEWFETEDRLDTFFVVGATRLLKLGRVTTHTSE